MDWKRVVNAGLIRGTGHRIVRVPPVAAPSPRPAAARKDRKRPARAAGSPPSHYDDEVRRIIRTVQARTMTSNQKLHALIAATRHVADHRVPGAMVECGVWRGGSMQAIALALMARGATERDLHLYDTFEGMPPPTGEDRRHDGRPAADLLSRASRDRQVWAVADIEDVRAGMAETGYPPERVHLHPGMVEDTIPDQAPAEIALLRLDTDWYGSTRHELEHLYDRVPAGGVIVFDDYGYWEGARQAADEFLGARGDPLLLVPVATGRIAVKP